MSTAEALRDEGMAAAVEALRDTHLDRHVTEWASWTQPKGTP